MSRSIDVFIDCDDQATALAAVAEAAGHPPTEVAAGRWQVDIGGGDVATLGRHDFVDDGDLLFTSYPYDLWVRVPNEGPVLDHRATEALRVVGERLRQAGYRAITVVDLQYRLDTETADPGHSAPAAP